MKRIVRTSRALALTVVILLCFICVAVAEPWYCPKCGAQNNGNFCTNCAQPRPKASTSWICGRCGNECEDNFNFCPNCAEPRPIGNTVAPIVSLRDLEPYTYKNGGLSYPPADVTRDIMGKSYDWGFVTWDEMTYSTWDIGKKYTTLSGTVAVFYNTRGGKGKGYIRIYGDDRLLFDAEDIAPDTKSYPIEVDISGVTDLKVEMRGGTDTYAGIGIMLADVQLR